MLKKRDSNAKTIASPLSPLDEIRQCEAVIAAEMLIARQQAEAILQSALNQARQIKEQARQAGAQAGQAQYNLQLQEAMRQAEREVAEAHAFAEVIAQRWQQRVPEAARWVMELVLGLNREELKP